MIKGEFHFLEIAGPGSAELQLGTAVIEPSWSSAFPGPAGDTTAVPRN